VCAALVSNTFHECFGSVRCKKYCYSNYQKFTSVALYSIKICDDDDDDDGGGPA